MFGLCLKGTFTIFSCGHLNSIPLAHPESELGEGKAFGLGLIFACQNASSGPGHRRKEESGEQRGGGMHPE